MGWDPTRCECVKLVLFPWPAGSPDRVVDGAGWGVVFGLPARNTVGSDAKFVSTTRGPAEAAVAEGDEDFPSAVSGLSFSSMDLSIALLKVTRGERRGTGCRKVLVHMNQRS